MREERGAPWAERPVRPVGLPGSRRLLTAASRRVEARIVVVVGCGCEDLAMGELLDGACIVVMRMGEELANGRARDYRSWEMVGGRIDLAGGEG